MARRLGDMLRHLRAFAGPDGAGDAELLGRWVRQRDEAAFELLLWRHAGLVLGVCRRLLRHEQDAEDAFQATFLALARQAPSIARRGSVAAWLYKVAYRTALRARRRAEKVAGRERAGGDGLAVQPAADPAEAELWPILDDELNRLPERLRRPFVLCYLEGKTTAEAAGLLGCPAGTVASRLSRGRERLRRRLLRRGVTLSAAALTAALARSTAGAAPAVPWVQSALRVARLDAGAVPPRVAVLTEGVLRAMFLTKLKTAAVLVLAAAVLAAGGVLGHALLAAPQREAPPPEAKADDGPRAKAVRVRVVRPKPGGLPSSTTAPVSVQPAEQTRVVPLVSGTIKEVTVDIGDRVKRGQTLIVLDAPLLEKELEQAAAALLMAEAQTQEAEARVRVAEAEMEVAEVNVKKAEVDLQAARAGIANAEALRAGHTAAKAELKARAGKVAHARAALLGARANVRVAKTARDRAEIQFASTRLRAAFDGVVTRRTANEGDYVQASDSRLLTPLLTVERFDPVRVVVEVPARDAPLLARGDPADLQIDALPGVRIPGLKVTRFSPTLRADTGTMRVEIDVPNADGRVMPGMAGQVTIHFKNRRPGAIVVPLSCLQPAAERAPFDGWVYVVRDGKAHRVQVIVREIDGRSAEVVQGITAEDVLVREADALKGDVVPVEITKER